MKTVCKILGEAMTPEQARIYKDPEKAAQWAVIRKRRFPEAEPYIAQVPYWAMGYAQWVLKDRFPEAEQYLAPHPSWAYFYAKDVIKGRWPEGELSILHDAQYAWLYAYTILKRRWPEAEEAMANSDYRGKYLKAFPEAKDDWITRGWTDWMDI